MLLPQLMLLQADGVLKMHTHSKHTTCDRTEEQKQAVVKVVESLEQAGSVKDVDYTGTTWRLVFSTSTSESAGKLGPFTGRVRQARSTTSSATTAQLAGMSWTVACLLNSTVLSCVLTTRTRRSSQLTCPASI